MGVVQSELEKLLAGQAGVGVAKEAGGEQDGPTKVHLRRGEHEHGLCPRDAATQAQELRDRVEREGAVGVIVGVCAKAF
jgi:hypothetical protein